MTGAGFPQPHAIVMLSEEARARLDKGELTREEVVHQLEVHRDEVNAKIPVYEALQFLAITKDEWQIENGFLTPTMKLKRAVVEDAYGPLAEGWHGSGEKAVRQE